MKLTNLNNIVEGETYYIQTQNYKFKAVYDRYEKGKFHFKKIIRLNTPKDWIGYIGTYEYMYYTIYESQKTKIQTAMETRAMNEIIINLIGTTIS
jgi:biotin-(acetyl-CoA carboxylase) ligase